jgi:hypothetical protein
MNRTLLASALLLLLACGLAWSASSPDLKALDGAQGAMLMTKPTPTPTPPPPGPCTVTCWPDPYDPSAPPITCTSQTGHCASGGKGTYFYIMCDGNTFVCPEY